MWSRMPKLGTSGSERGWASIRKKRARLLTTLCQDECVWDGLKSPKVICKTAQRPRAHARIMYGPLIE
jgi:hypothetical protein